jgi:hypothetical protein
MRFAYNFLLFPGLGGSVSDGQMKADVQKPRVLAIAIPTCQKGS